MRIFYILLILSLFSLSSFGQYSNYERAYGIVPYRTALTFSNPLSFSSKYGGGVEHRLGNFSYMASYYIYKGAYPGAMTDFDIRLYAKKRWRHITHKFIYQNFIYVRPFIGIAAFDGNKLDVVGYPDDIFWYEKAYVGNAIGMGRRYHKGMFFVTVKAGLRITALEAIEPQAQHLYKLFYFTGPGSVLEVNFQFGIQY